ncbi:hypothetical protein HDA40_001937 [Hamadaea flava]|uniref:Uncharacterized protein n=1 Tax=Hamadaea flava TaxID=1742688 RepID=A0ABV8LEK2_9ACTN|nr:hypothetical protein [Hamadaea flava]MCP2323430.1 hypothetical protein [Hamadaea flava]
MPPSDCPPEQPIAALIPAALPRARPEPAPVGDLPPTPQGDGDVTAYACARLTPSGVIRAGKVLTALSWLPHDRVAFTVEHGCIVAALADHGGRPIGAGGSLVLPIAARRMCAILTGSQVLLAALPDAGLLVVHPIARIDRQLARRHGQIVRGRDGRPG